MTIKNPESLTPDDALNIYAKILQRQAEDALDIQTLRNMLTVFRKEGLIGDKVEHPEFSLKWTKKETWQYTKELKAAQAMERMEHIATKKTTYYWVARKTKTESLF